MNVFSQLTLTAQTGRVWNSATVFIRHRRLRAPSAMGLAARAVGLGTLTLCGCTALFDGNLASDTEVPPLSPYDGEAVEPGHASAELDGPFDAGSESPLEEAEHAQPDATSDAPFEGGRGTCASNLLTPVMATASSATAPNVAGYAIDGLLTTRWESVDGVDPQWLIVDFGALAFVDEVDVLWEAACASDYTLDVSMDGMTWMTIPNGTVTGNTQAANMPGDPPTPPTDWSAAVVSKNLHAVGRYLRVDGTTRCTVYGYSIWEMRAYGDDDIACTP
jgi:hypothetical protein